MQTDILGGENRRKVSVENQAFATEIKGVNPHLNKTSDPSLKTVIRGHSIASRPILQRNATSNFWQALSQKQTCLQNTNALTLHEEMKFVY